MTVKINNLNINIYEEIERLLQFGLKKRLIETEDMDYTRNALLAVLQLDEFLPVEVGAEELESPVTILERMLDWAAENDRLEENTVTYRDLLDTKIMGCLVSKPSEILRTFQQIYQEEGADAATKYLYDLSMYSHYIRTDRIAKNEHWIVSTEYGDMEMTINLSKPEKDPKAIAAAKFMKQSSYPNCLLCRENVGYAGRVNHPARQNLRTIPLQLGKECWHLQFSPYVYYHEHAIVFLDEHLPMQITKKTFDRLVRFTDQFPHYFLGSNADLPIVGGSILSHDHFQGGKHIFPMATAEMEAEHRFAGYEEVRAGIVKWPMSVLRLQAKRFEPLVELANDVLEAWKGYSDESVDILSHSGDTPHNTITPIARRKGELFELDLVLRNNRTTPEHPMGLFHPHEEVHHIKKENIGLIEVMGLAVLPGRLKEEIQRLTDMLINNQREDELKDDELVSKHMPWVNSLKEKYSDLSLKNKSDVMDILKHEIGLIFVNILEHAGVFKRDQKGQEAFRRFLKSI
ncbi:UDP-glucose--hexose-1-phosphate uridylyltransferase [Caldalkalibacillus mannanilyticus]|uniref:UDP-glucose--hexose-1-phosphate uridylyltransferase n=1 Tax=Caldalkalibacillus mannanilyticus TaxID=1418 RepID=UPI0005552EB1|nr:UDP-glucose--hexose-1-phosphate uridylyltransferase [Caldalkalibacillus mannanilyticus]